MNIHFLFQNEEEENHVLCGAAVNLEDGRVSEDVPQEALAGQEGRVYARAVSHIQNQSR